MLNTDKGIMHDGIKLSLTADRPSFESLSVGIELISLIKENHCFIQRICNYACHITIMIDTMSYGYMLPRESTMSP